MDWWYFLPNSAEAKLADLEDRSCKNNLHINGVKEEYGETLETSETKLQQILEKTLEIGQEIVIGCVCIKDEKGDEKEYWKSEPSKSSCSKINVI